MEQQNNPTAFISYSWDSDEHKMWVRELATRLRQDGVNVTLDQWHTVPGDQLPQFMETAVRENDYVIAICTRRYRERSDNRTGGVGYEGDIITGEVSTNRNHRKSFQFCGVMIGTNAHRHGYGANITWILVRILTPRMPTTICLQLFTAVGPSRHLLES